MTKLRYIREDLPRTKNTMHIRGHSLNPIEEIIVMRLNEVIQVLNEDKTIPRNAPTRKEKSKAAKMVEEANEEDKKTGFSGTVESADLPEHNNTNNELD